MMSLLYNKLVFLHFNPGTGQQGGIIHIYELDPSYSYRTPTPIQLAPSSAGHLIQLQIVENLIVVHDLDAKTIQAYDIKIGTDFGIGLLKEGCQVAQEASSLIACIAEEEVKMNDDTYKLTTVPLKTQFHQTVPEAPTTEAPKQ